MAEVVIAGAAYVVISNLLKKEKNKRRFWIQQIYRNRKRFGGSQLLRELHPEQFQNFVRMAPEDFEYLVNSIGPEIVKKDTKLRNAVSVKERLALTLHFLATGDSYTSLQYLFKVSKQLISTIVPEVCCALINVLKDHIKMPQTADEWQQISNEFENLWNFPLCIGAMDGKHVVLQCPIGSGSEYYNYKSFFSIVLFALVDANYKFLFVDVGCQGRISDGGVFRHSKLHRSIEMNKLNLPGNTALPGRNRLIPYVILGDEAFPLTENIMKPYSGTHRKGSPERIFNYRLSRARRVVENAFGIASSVFRVLRKPLLLEPEKAQIIVLTVTYLHNFLRTSKLSQNIYSPPGSLDYESNGNLKQGTWRTGRDDNRSSLLPLTNVPRRSSENAKTIRQEFSEYFVTNGRVIWQDDHA